MYAARWERPHGVLATTEGSGEMVMVLKDVVSCKAQKEDPMEKTLQEVRPPTDWKDICLQLIARYAYASLAGSAVSCVGFLDVAVFEQWSNVKDKTQGAPTSEYWDGLNIFLVFERATQGTIPTFLEGHLKDVGSLSVWIEPPGHSTPSPAG
jgi:hypothetical protein